MLNSEVILCGRRLRLEPLLERVLPIGTAVQGPAARREDRNRADLGILLLGIALLVELSEN
jgi:hypothetical protein